MTYYVSFRVNIGLANNSTLVTNVNENDLTLCMLGVVCAFFLSAFFHFSNPL